eukprot:CAMPEP_0171965370 /NCGR_PEP_ID=MMETSP0993-20121228/186850_1 /TAXON_ID=483369 /ORGANISM="non described non described, Strain CCMP2098" /LENGTH=323 /DNA_ID=CAMNT_0012614405 /DNA_START=130 /DNA_END=1101 /DNA_ORIENTATION=+
MFRGSELLWFSQSLLPALIPRAAWPGVGASTPILLGKQAPPPLVGGASSRVFAVDLAADSNIHLEGDDSIISAKWVALRSLLARGDAAWLSVAGLGSSMVVWSRANHFCGACGNATAAVTHGTQRQCANEACKRKAYPRTDPVVIMSVVDEQEGKLLLGRGSKFKPGFFSCLAGFVEPCESLEAAAVREVFEEAGLHLDSSSLRVVQSQPWPIGRALSCELMVGLRASTAAPRASTNPALLTLQADELAEVRWVTRLECRKALAASMNGPLGSMGEGLDWYVPGPYAIAHHLISAFACEGDAELDACIAGNTQEGSQRKAPRL